MMSPEYGWIRVSSKKIDLPRIVVTLLKGVILHVSEKEALTLKIDQLSDIESLFPLHVNQICQNEDQTVSMD
jgi:hypothetical protein